MRNCRSTSWPDMGSGWLVLPLALLLGCSPRTTRAGQRPTTGAVQQAADPAAPLEPVPSSLGAQQKPPPCTEAESATQFCLLRIGDRCTDPSTLLAEMSARFDDVRKRHCDGTTVVSYADPMGAMEFFFDDAQRLVAARHRADTNCYCKSSSFTAWFGTPLPECTSLQEFTVADFNALLQSPATHAP
jgi:hypothetical protein